MKAYVLSIKNDDDQGQAIVFANNRTEAKQKLCITNLDANCWTDIQASRYPDLDGMENAEEPDIALVLWRNGWRWFDYRTPDPFDTTAEEFKAWYCMTILEVKK